MSCKTVVTIRAAAPLDEFLVHRPFTGNQELGHLAIRQLAVERVPDEIRRDAAGNGIKHERQDDGAKAGAYDHSARMRRFA